MIVRSTICDAIKNINLIRAKFSKKWTLEEKCISEVLELFVRSYLPGQNQYNIELLHRLPLFVQKNVYVHTKKMFCRKFIYKIERIAQLFVRYDNFNNNCVFLMILHT